MKRKILSLLLAVILFCLPVFYACGEKEKEKPDGEIDFKVGFYDTGDSGYYYQLLETPLIINTTEEWDTVKDIRNYMTEEEKEDYERLLSMGGARESLPTDIKEKYNKKFFKKNSLIIYPFCVWKGINTIKITKVHQKNDELIIEIDIDLSVTEMMSYGMFIVEIKKSDIPGVSNIYVVENITELGSQIKQ